MPIPNPDSGLYRLTRTRRQTAWWLLRSPMTAALALFLLTVTAGILILWPTSAGGGCGQIPPTTGAVTRQQGRPLPGAPPVGRAPNVVTDADGAIQRIEDSTAVPAPPSLSIASAPPGCGGGLGPEQLQEPVMGTRGGPDQP